MAHIGVRNRTKEAQVLAWDGKAYDFAPSGEKGDTRILADVPEHHIVSRMHVAHAAKKVVVDGRELVEQLKHLQGMRLFEIIPLVEALKVASPDEDPRIVRARQDAEAKVKERQALIAEVKEALLPDLEAQTIEKLKAAGWVAPAAKTEVPEEELLGQESH